jgi:hypothetical protein
MLVRQCHDPASGEFADMTADIDRYRTNLRDELNGAALYEALAAAEVDPLSEDLFLQLAQAESSHAKLWRDTSG